MATRAIPMARETFELFAISASQLSGIGTVQPLDEFDDLATALETGALRIPHKAHFMVRHTNVLSGAVMLKFYAVRQKSKPAHRYHEYQTRAVRDRYPEHLFDLDGGALS